MIDVSDSQTVSRFRGCGRFWGQICLINNNNLKIHMLFRCKKMYRLSSEINKVGCVVYNTRSIICYAEFPRSPVYLGLRLG